MVIGDVVSEIAADNVTLVFIPAVGVEIIVSSYGNLNSGTAGNFYLLNAGADRSETNTLAFTDNKANAKIFINNTNHFTILSNGAGVHISFTGIQINQ